MDFSFFKNKKIFISGHTGFKGSWLCFWLNKLGAEVYGFSDIEYDTPSAFNSMNIKSFLKSDLRGDISNFEEINNALNEINPDIVFHLAAQALVGKSIKDPLHTFKVNSLGTLNIAYALSNMSNQIIFVCITSDKVYENFEWIWGYRENDTLGGKDPYSASKAMAELGLRALFKTHLKNTPNLKIAVARAGNVIGGGDWSEDRIVPDAMKAWKKNNVLKLRSPNSTRPWQHVMEPIGGYLFLAKWLADIENLNDIEAFNFGPKTDQNISVLELVKGLSSKWDGSEIKILESDSLSKSEAGLLRLNCDKSHKILNWEAKLNFSELISLTSDWYKSFYFKNDDCSAITDIQISNYQKKLEK